MLLQDLLAYVFIGGLTLLTVVQTVRSIKNAKRVRLGFNAGICADCGTRWHDEYSYANEDHAYQCKCGKHTLPTSRFVTCDVLPEPTAETFMDQISSQVAYNEVTFEIGHRMREIVQKMPQDQVLENVQLLNRSGVLVLLGRSHNCTRQLRVGPKSGLDEQRSRHVAHYDAEGPSECLSGIEVTEMTLDMFLQRVLFTPVV